MAHTLYGSLAWTTGFFRPVAGADMKSFGMRKVLNSTYEQALTQVPEALKSEGFGVLTEIDMQQTLKQKLGVEFRRYKILGACNPPLAHEALQTALEVGLMLPCNVVVYEGDDSKTVVMAIDPTMTVGSSGDEKIMQLAEKVKAKLEKVLSKLES